MKKTYLSIFAFAAGCVAGGSVYNCFHHCVGSQGSKLLTLSTETVVVLDTLHPAPKLVAECAAPRVVSIPADRFVSPVSYCDSAPAALLPDTLKALAVQRVYADSVCRVVVSGIDPRLDSISLHLPRMAITRTVIPEPLVLPSRRGNRWSLGVTAGLTASPHGVQPGVCIGLSYRIL